MFEGCAGKTKTMIEAVSVLVDNDFSKKNRSLRAVPTHKLLKELEDRFSQHIYNKSIVDVHLDRRVKKVTPPKCLIS